MDISPSGATLGATVQDIDLRALSEDAFLEIEAAWHEHAVLVFREQFLSDTEQIAFSRRFGRLERGLRRSSSSPLAHLSNVKADGTLATPDALQMRFHQGNLQWHTDSSYKRVGAKASILAARQVPDTGGETEWADMRAAYDALDELTKRRIDGKIAVHSYVYSHTWHGGQEIIDNEDLKNLPPVEHPLVRIHPATGRPNLYIGRHASHILGEPEADSRAFLKALVADACQPPRVWKYRWRAGDIGIWDNRCVLHRGHTWLPQQPRDMVRTTIAGEDADNEWAFPVGAFADTE